MGHYFDLSDVTSRDGQAWCLRSFNRFQTSKVKTDSQDQDHRPSPKCIKQTPLLSHFLDVLPPNPSEMHFKNKNFEEKQAHTILAQPSTICHISDGQLFICPSYFLITNRFVVMFSFSGLSLDLCPNIVVRAIQVLLSLFRFLSFPPQFFWTSSSFQFSLFSSSISLLNKKQETSTDDKDEKEVGGGVHFRGTAHLEKRNHL